MGRSGEAGHNGHLTQRQRTENSVSSVIRSIDRLMSSSDALCAPARVCLAGCRCRAEKGGKALCSRLVCVDRCETF